MLRFNGQEGNPTWSPHLKGTSSLHTIMYPPSKNTQQSFKRNKILGVICDEKHLMKKSAYVFYSKFYKRHWFAAHIIYFIV